MTLYSRVTQFLCFFYCNAFYVNSLVCVSRDVPVNTSISMVQISYTNLKLYIVFVHCLLVLISRSKFYFLGLEYDCLALYTAY
jgi:hypothetical protein